jgi:hypothetical protein
MKKPARSTKESADDQSRRLMDNLKRLPGCSLWSQIPADDFYDLIGTTHKKRNGLLEFWVGAEGAIASVVFYDPHQSPAYGYVVFQREANGEYGTVVEANGVSATQADALDKMIDACHDLAEDGEDETQPLQ